MPSMRVATGLSGLFAVSTILLVSQLASGISGALIF